MKRPSGDTASSSLSLSPRAPAGEREIAHVCPVTRLRTKIWDIPPVCARLDDHDWNTASRPASTTAPAHAPWFATAPALVRSTSFTHPVRMSRTNTSQVPLRSPTTRLEASDQKVTYRPRGETGSG